MVMHLLGYHPVFLIGCSGLSNAFGCIKCPWCDTPHALTWLASTSVLGGLKEDQFLVILCERGP